MTSLYLLGSGRVLAMKCHLIKLGVTYIGNSEIQNNQILRLYRRRSVSKIAWCDVTSCFSYAAKCCWILHKSSKSRCSRYRVEWLAHGGPRLQPITGRMSATIFLWEVQRFASPHLGVMVIYFMEWMLQKPSQSRAYWKVVGVKTIHSSTTSWRLWDLPLPLS